MKSSSTSFAARPLRLDLTPFEVVKCCAHLPDLVFFDSALEQPEAVSIIAACPREIVHGSSPVDWKLLGEKVRASQHAARADDGIPHGMAAGWVEYDGTFRFGFYDDLLVYRHADESWCEMGDFFSKLRFAGSSPAAVASRLDFQPTMTRAHFCEMVERAQRYIAAGDIYQVNLSQKFTSPWSDERGDALRFYEALRTYSPAPYAAFLRSPQRTIFSCSPESFLHMSGSRIQTRPIKGTRPRRADPGADEKSAFDLLTSPKEIAELVMITDLERNDLGQICEYGSVNVRELLKLERYEQVFHLVSTVEGQLRADADHVSALRACFPGGSITGAPKKRARKIIAELEPVSRGLYTGAIGFFGFNGESQFNIAIRTAVVENGVAHFHVGAGIVADSMPEMEYEETLHKAAGILLAAARM